MHSFGTICAVLVAYLEILLFLNAKAKHELSSLAPHSHPAPPDLPWFKDLEMLCASMCMFLSLAPMVHTVSAADKTMLPWTLGNLSLSSATLYSSCVEFIGAYHGVKMHKFLPDPLFPMCVAAFVLLARVVQKWDEARRTREQQKKEQQQKQQQTEQEQQTEHNIDIPTEQ